MTPSRTTPSLVNYNKSLGSILFRLVSKACAHALNRTYNTRHEPATQAIGHRHRNTGHNNPLHIKLTAMNGTKQHRGPAILAQQHTAAQHKEPASTYTLSNKCRIVTQETRHGNTRVGYSHSHKCYMYGTGCYTNSTKSAKEGVLTHKITARSMRMCTRAHARARVRVYTCCCPVAANSP